MAATACASGRGRAPLETRPRIVSRIVWPALAAPPRARGEDPLVDPVHIYLRVVVDSTGRADLTSLSTVGRGASENQFALRTWLVESQFEPARRDGRAVSGIYERDLRVRAALRP